MRPTKPQGSNVLLHDLRDRPNIGPVGNHNYEAYFYNADHGRVGTVERATLAEYLPQLEPFRTASLFFDHTAHRFWCVDFDAIENPVGDGLPYDADPDSEASDEEEEEPFPRMDWMPLGFRWQISADGVTPSGLSTLEVSAWTLNPQVHATRGEQNWPDRLLPPNYHPADVRYRQLIGYQPPFGSLNGNLAALIALVAYSASPRDNNVRDALIRCIRGTQWQTPHAANGCKYPLKSESIIFSL
jgi:hypothetical protein